MTVGLKKALILNLPYLLFVYLFDKLCQAVRLVPGVLGIFRAAGHGELFRLG